MMIDWNEMTAVMWNSFTGTILVFLTGILDLISPYTPYILTATGILTAVFIFLGVRRLKKRLEESLF